MIYRTKVLQMRKINLPHNAYLNSLQNHSLYRVLREIGKTTFRRKKQKKNPKPTQKDNEWNKSIRVKHIHPHT